jgi:hypothetical protein
MSDTKKPETHVESVPQYIDEYSPDVAMRMMRSHLAMSEEVRRNGGGRWEVPHTHRHMVARGDDGRPAYRFTRLGTMSDVRRRDAVLRQQAILELMGWKLAPKGTRNSLFLADGELGVYMCIAEVVGKELDAHEKKTRDQVRQRRFGKSLNRLPEDLQSLGSSMRVEGVDVQQGTMSVDEFRRSR